MMWSLYVKEKSGVETISDEHGFICYKIHGEECYLEDIFVIPEYRERGVGSDLLIKAEALAKEAGCKFLSSCIRPTESTATLSMKAHLAKGFRIYSSFENRILMIKEIL